MRRQKEAIGGLNVDCNSGIRTRVPLHCLHAGCQTKNPVKNVAARCVESLVGLDKNVAGLEGHNHHFLQSGPILEHSHQVNVLLDTWIPAEVLCRNLHQAISDTVKKTSGCVLKANPSGFGKKPSLNMAACSFCSGNSRAFRFLRGGKHFSDLKKSQNFQRGLLLTGIGLFYGSAPKRKADPRASPFTLTDF